MPATRRTKKSSIDGDEEFVPRTPYQEWVNPAMKRAGIGISELAAAVEVDRTYLWRIARGNPEVYPKQRRPGYELAFAIGERLGDVIGSLKAAEYPIPADSKEVSPGETLYFWRTGQKVNVRMTDEVIQRLMLEADFQEGRDKGE